jgi:hypothetical protein
MRPVTGPLRAACRWPPDGRAIPRAGLGEKTMTATKFALIITSLAQLVTAIVHLLAALGDWHDASRWRRRMLRALGQRRKYWLPN